MTKIVILLIFSQILAQQQYFELKQSESPYLTSFSILRHLYGGRCSEKQQQIFIAKMDRQPSPQKFIFCVHAISTKLFLLIKLQSGKVTSFFYIVGNTQSDPKCYKNVAFYLKMSKSKWRLQIPPSKIASGTTKVNVCSQLTYKSSLKISD